MSYIEVCFYEIRCDNCTRLWSPGAQWRTKQIAEHWFTEAAENGRNHSWTKIGDRRICGYEDCEERTEECRRR